MKVRFFDEISKNLTKLLKFILNKKLLFWLYIAGLFMPPIILAIPWPLYIGIYGLKITEKKETDKNELPIPRDAQSMGNSLFSKISGIGTYTYPTMVCVLNSIGLTHSAQIVCQFSHKSLFAHTTICHPESSYTQA